ncbi:MAG: hypothetical protein AB1925_13170 [Actinomycetota bacterium]
MAAVPGAIVAPATAHAAGPVMYEVISNYFAVATVDYTDMSGRSLPQTVTLPWRSNVVVPNPYDVGTQLHVTWQPPERFKWVIIRIFYRGSKLCEATLDTGDSTCTARGLYGGQIPKFLPPIEPPAARQ